MCMYVLNVYGHLSWSEPSLLNITPTEWTSHKHGTHAMSTAPPRAVVRQLSRYHRCTRQHDISDGMVANLEI